MANQPPFRPWFRMAYMARPPLPNTPPAAPPPSAPTPPPAPAPQTQVQPPAPEPRPLPQPRSQQEAAPLPLVPAVPPPPLPPPPPPPPVTSPTIPIAAAMPMQPPPPSPPPPSADALVLPSPVNNPAAATSVNPSAVIETSNILPATAPRSPAASSVAISTSPPLTGIKSPSAKSSPVRSPPSASLASESPKLAVVAPSSPKRISPSPPSPVSLPPPVLRSDGEDEPKIPTVAEMKTVLMQEALEKPNLYLRTPDESSVFGRAGGRTSIGSSRSHEKPNMKNIPKKPSSESVENCLGTITIAGENKGAVMELGYSHSRRGNHVGNPHSYSLRSPSDELGGDHSGSEGGVKLKHRGQRAVAKPSILNAYMNSNVQCVTNTILYESSCTHHDPGIHLSGSGKPVHDGHGIHLKEHGDSTEDP